MSRGQRMGLIALAVVIAAVAFVIARPKHDNKDSSSNAAAKSGAPKRIVLKNYAVQGGVQKLTAAKGDRVRFQVTDNKKDQIHLHGYNIEKDLAPGKYVTFDFRANVEGVFEIESHGAEHRGKPALIGRLSVGPSS